MPATSEQDDSKELAKNIGIIQARNPEVGRENTVFCPLFHLIVCCCTNGIKKVGTNNVPTGPENGAIF